MAANDFSKFFSQDRLNFFPGFSNVGSGMQALMDAQRKNMEALAEIQQLTFEGFQACVSRQSELLSALLQSNSKLARELMGEDTPEHKIAHQTDLLKKNYEQSVAGLRELADMINKSSLQASDIVNKRVTATLSEVKSALEKGTVSSSKSKAAA